VPTSAYDLARFLLLARREDVTEVPMNPRSPITVATFAAISLNLTACELVKGIFKAGVWVGVFGVLGLVVLVALGLGMLRR
jgi:hypothetical protein